MKEVGTATSNDVSKFGTYTRDAASGLDYAMNRYYQSTWGRFTTADPYRASGGPADPGSWNRYAYVQGDPVNYGDPSGLLRDPCDDIEMQDHPACVYKRGGSGRWGIGVGSYANGEYYSNFYASVWIPNPLPGGSNGGGNKGISLAVEHLQTIATGNFQTKQKCHDFLAALIMQNGLSTSVTMLSGQIMTMATSATAFVYDGPSSNTVLSADKFPGAASPGVNTVAAWFTANSGAVALSQYNGAAIWIRSNDWTSALGGLVSSSFAGQYGLGTMMHELLHKQGVAGGFTHSQMASALSAIGISPGDYPLGRNAISDQVGRICF